MPTIGEVIAALETIAPPELAYPNDPIGLQIGRKSDTFERCVVALDVSPAPIDFAATNGAELIVAHHAPIYHPISHLSGDGFNCQTVRTAVQAGIAVIVAHTNWDAAVGGVNDSLATALNLLEVHPFGDDTESTALKVVVFVPVNEADTLIDALAEAGAGGLGLYRRCAFYSPGIGTFEPQPGASPAIGEINRREHVEEARIEMRLPARLRTIVERALLRAHPYEEPAYDFWHVSPSPASIGRMGNLPEPVPFAELRTYVDRALGSRCELFGKLERKVSKIGVIGGAGGRFWTHAKSSGCDLLLTGESRHHEGLAAAESGFGIVEAGHYHTEQPGMVALAKRLQEEFPHSNFSVYEPNPGRCGRPD
jgi:dinuclear metal center YbgI/SA1388 family protein